jgi:hypothetical protein
MCSFMKSRRILLGMFIIDEFEFRDLHGKPLESQTRPPQVAHSLMNHLTYPLRKNHHRSEGEVSATNQSYLYH